MDQQDGQTREEGMMHSSITHCLSDPRVQKPKSAYRTTLLAARKKYALSADHDRALAAKLTEILAQYRPRCIGLYWPLKGEFDARAVLAQWLMQSPSHSAALPVIANRNGPLEFWKWTPDSELALGPHNIPIPAHKVLLDPDLLCIPCLGFDATRLRLGYGGGYYDRTLAARSPRPIAIGLAYEYTRLPALPVEPHDVRLDQIVSEAACY